MKSVSQKLHKHERKVRAKLERDGVLPQYSCLDRSYDQVVADAANDIGNLNWQPPKTPKAPRKSKTVEGLGILYDVNQLADLFGGEVSRNGRELLAPGPKHSDFDRSMSVRPDPAHPDGFVVHSYSPATSDFECKDYVQNMLDAVLNAAIAWTCNPANLIGDFEVAPYPGLTITRPGGGKAHINELSEKERIARIDGARKKWRHAGPRMSAPAIAYFESRGLIVPSEMLDRIIRFATGRWYHDQGQYLDQNNKPFDADVPMILFAIRDLIKDEGIGVQAVRLPHIGKGPERKIHGIAKGGAIKLTRHKTVVDSGELVIGEGFKSCLAAMILGHKNVWSVLNANLIAEFPVLDGIHKLTILGEHDRANEIARNKCGTRWIKAGREVSIAMPRHGNDFNDDLFERAVMEADANG